MELSLKNYIKRFTILIIGLVVCAYGCATTVNAHMGLSPWDMLSDGLSKQLTNFFGREIMIGTLTQIIGIIVLAADVLMKEKIGFGTILNIALIGHFTNVFLKSNLLLSSQNLFLRFVIMVIGFVILGFGIYFYMLSGLGAGPRDSFMLALARRKIPVSTAKNSMEFFAFVTGFIAGGEMGIGTVVAVFIMGYILKYVFRLFNFDMTQVKHESVFDTLKNLKVIVLKQNA